MKGREGSGGRTRPIRIRPLAAMDGGYRVLASWHFLPSLRKRSQVHLWIPELAPQMTVLRDFRMGRIDWNALATLYARQLRSPQAQDRLKPLALLSRRKTLVLLCDCSGKCPCPNPILKRAIEECRKRKSFVLNPMAY